MNPNRLFNFFLFGCLLASCSDDNTTPFRSTTSMSINWEGTFVGTITTSVAGGPPNPADGSSCMMTLVVEPTGTSNQWKITQAGTACMAAGLDHIWQFTSDSQVITDATLDSAPFPEAPYDWITKTFTSSELHAYVQLPAWLEQVIILKLVPSADGTSISFTYSTTNGGSGFINHQGNLSK